MKKQDLAEVSLTNSDSKVKSVCAGGRTEIKCMRGERHHQVLAVQLQHDVALDAFLTLIIAHKIVESDEPARKETKFVVLIIKFCYAAHF